MGMPFYDKGGAFVHPVILNLDDLLYYEMRSLYVPFGELALTHKSA